MFFFLVLPIVAMKLAEIYVWLRGVINEHVLNRPVFLPTRVRSEVAEIEKVKNAVDAATNRIYWAQSDLRRYVSPR